VAQKKNILNKAKTSKNNNFALRINVTELAEILVAKLCTI
jgi:hypothetical protein